MNKKIVICLITLFFAVSCTIVPKPVDASHISYSETGLDSGIISVAKDASGKAIGFLVNETFRKNYNSLIEKYGIQLLVKPQKDEELIIQGSGFYVISPKGMQNFMKMMRLYRSGKAEDSLINKIIDKVK
jgi:hypothetical protein